MTSKDITTDGSNLLVHESVCDAWEFLARPKYARIEIDRLHCQGVKSVPTLSLPQIVLLVMYPSTFLWHIFLAKGEILELQKVP